GTSTVAAEHRRPMDLVLATITIGLSWFLIHTMFALHYAHEFYDEIGAPGLAFPGGDGKPAYWDFVYFSLIIGMTAQVADVGYTCTRFRRTVTAQSVGSFFSNAPLLAITVNIAASAI